MRLLLGGVTSRAIEIIVATILRRLVPTSATVVVVDE